MALAPHAPWHALSKEEVTEHLGTSPRGFLATKHLHDFTALGLTS